MGRVSARYARNARVDSRRGTGQPVRTTATAAEGRSRDLEQEAAQMADTARTDEEIREGSEPSLKRVMGPGLLLLFIVGDILGTGIYALTGQVAAQVGGV